MIHTLKIEPNYLQNLLEGRKRCEVRYNDRDYQPGDTLRFYHKPDYNEGVYVFFRVTHIHSGLGLKEGYVVLSVERVSEP